ncbi:MAG: serine/threonine-protein phosphatase [Actinomycetota bacterium]|nr:serine/threonine-protein phosphatase [Actinomycetota bacterium]
MRPGRGTDAATLVDQLATRLLDISSQTHPEELSVVLAREAATVGLGDASVYLQDFDHELLLPLPGAAHAYPQDIDGTPAGQAFRTDRVVALDVDDRHHAWVPLRDGGERVGVLALTLPPGDATPHAPLLRLSRVLASLLVVKGAYSDAFFLARRLKPMTIAAEMQWHLLPPLTLQTPRVSIAGMLAPAYEVGGDAFDYAVNGDVLHFAIFDAMGHGLGAAILTAAVVGGYRHARRARVGLRDTYLIVDDVVRSHFGEEHFATAQLATIDLPTGVLRWVNAGHPRPLLVRDGRVARSLRGPTTLPIGFEGEPPEVTEEQLQPGDRLIFFTDGVIEEHTPDGVELGVEGLTAFLDSVEDERLPVAETARAVSLHLARSRAGTPTDDSTVVLLEWRP